MSLADATEIRSERYRFLRFLVVGGLAAVVNILSRIALNLVMSYEVAIAAAYLCGMITAYALNRLFVFKPSGRAVHDEYLRFTLVNLVALAQVWLLSLGLALYLFPWIGLTWHAETIAHTIGVTVPALTSYVGHRHFSFSGRSP